MTGENVRLERDDRIWTVTFNRPEKRNVLDLPTSKEAQEARAEAEAVGGEAAAPAAPDQPGAGQATDPDRRGHRRPAGARRGTGGGRGASRRVAGYGPALRGEDADERSRGVADGEAGPERFKPRAGARR